MKITKAQKDALDVVMKLMDSYNPNKREYILTLICGILNIELEDDTSIITLNPNDVAGNDEIQLIIPDWIEKKQTPPFSPHTPFPPQVWYEQETEPIQPTARELRYATEVSCTGDKTGIISVTNTADVRYNGDKNCITTRDVSDCTTYTGDFRDTQTSFNDK